MVCSPVVLLANLYTGLLRAAHAGSEVSFPDDAETAAPDAAVLTPLVPGLTIPAMHGFILVAVLFVNVVFHEFGHAVAAVAANVGCRGGCARSLTVLGADSLRIHRP
jgi:hypothetical protein